MQSVKNMLEILKWVGFILLFLRYSYWVGSSLTLQEEKWKQVLLSQFFEALLLFFIYTQFFGRSIVLPMQPSVWQEVFGFILIIVGVGGAFLAKWELGNAWVYAAAYRVKPKQKLITSGIYALVRHPIYSCFVISYLGALLLAGSLLWVSVLFLFIPFFRQEKREEHMLLKHFGKRYEDYIRKTKMFIPWVF